jgi:hypothetical protein
MIREKIQKRTSSVRTLMPTMLPKSPAEKGENVHAKDKEIIDIPGNARTAIATSISRILVRGEITKNAYAEDFARISGHGNAKLIQVASMGSVILAGSPNKIEARDGGYSIIFGEPRIINANTDGHVTVITHDNEYKPVDYALNSGARITVITPLEGGLGEGADFLTSQLETLYPEGELDPAFVAYNGMLKNGFVRKELPPTR